MNKTKNQLSPLILSVLILSFLTAYFIFAWDDPTSAPPLGNVDAPINTGPTAQTKSEALTVGTLTTSGGVLDFSDSSKRRIERVDRVIGAGNLSLRSNIVGAEDGLIEIYGSKLNFYSYLDGLKWQISSTGTLAIGSVPWERLIDFSDDCPENRYIIGINEDGTFKCSFIDCEVIYKCAVSDGEGGCEPKGAGEPGEYGLPACQRCNETDLDPEYFDFDTYDEEGDNLCNADTGLCYACNGNGNCSYQTSNSDEGGQCPEYPEDNCSTGNCSGTGYSCGTYTDGQQNCELCMKCNPDGSGSCVNQTSDEDLENECSISACANGLCSGIGSSCQGYTDYKEVSGCNGVCYGCYSGECITMNNQKDAYGENQCINIHYGCESGVCTNPRVNSGCLGYYCSEPGGCFSMFPPCQACSSHCSGYDGCVAGYISIDCTGGNYGCGYTNSQSCICWNWKYD